LSPGRKLVFISRCTKAQYCDCMSSVRPSVCPPVTLLAQEQKGWKTWKLIAQPISPKAIHLLPGEHGEIWGSPEVGGEKWHGAQKRQLIYLKCIKMQKKLMWRAYRNSPTLFRTVPFPTPYGLLFLKIVVCNPHQNFNLYYLRNG